VRQHRRAQNPCWLSNAGVWRYLSPPSACPIGELIVTYRLLLTAILSLSAAPALAQAAAAQSPQPIAKTAFMQRIDRDFVAADANKDGFADRAELESAETKVLAARKAALLRNREAAFRQLDANKDGNLTLAEFNAAVNAAPLKKADAAPVLNRFDTNKDGKVSLAENRAPAIAQFDRADTNKDGTLSVDEQRAAAKQSR
jgi:Ca2+-binding EF-hand superfamily protein